MILPVVRLGYQRWRETIRPGDFQPIDYPCAGSQGQGLNTEGLCAEVINQIADSTDENGLDYGKMRIVGMGAPLPSDQVGEPVTEVVGEATFGVGLLDVHEGMRKSGSWTPEEQYQ